MEGSGTTAASTNVRKATSRFLLGEFPFGYQPPPAIFGFPCVHKPPGPYGSTETWPNPCNLAVLGVPTNPTTNARRSPAVTGTLKLNDVKTPGVAHAKVWDGRNNAGQPVSSGVYFYKLVTKNFAQTKKMVLVK